MSNVIEFPVIPRKAADRIVWEPHPEWRDYRCTDCGQEDSFRRRSPATAVYCRCGAEMRPVDAPKVEVR